MSSGLGRSRVIKSRLFSSIPPETSLFFIFTLGASFFRLLFASLKCSTFFSYVVMLFVMFAKYAARNPEPAPASTILLLELIPV